MYLYQIKPKKNSSFLRKLCWQLKMYKLFVIIALIVISVLGIIHFNLMNEEPRSMARKSKFIVGSDSKKYTYDRDMPLIFIGGVPRSDKNSVLNLP